MKTSCLTALATTALLACGLPAQAQTSTTVFGLIDLSIGSTKAPGGVATKGVDSGKMTTSYFGIKGVEDLGGGLLAVFRLEHFLRADTGSAGRFDADTFWSRNASVGISSKTLGTLTIGRNSPPLFIATLLFNPFGDSFGYSPAIRHYYTSGTVTGDSGWSDSVLYASPRFGGFSFGLAGAMKESSNGGNWSVNAGYSDGPLAASLVYQQVKKDGNVAVQDTNTWQLGAAYNFGPARLFLQYGDVSNRNTNVDYRISGLGVRVPMGQGALLAQWGHVSPSAGASRNTTTVGYTYALSKRSDLYGMLMSDQQSGRSSGGGYSLGLRHAF